MPIAGSNFFMLQKNALSEFFFLLTTHQIYECLQIPAMQDEFFQKKLCIFPVHAVYL